MKKRHSCLIALLALWGVTANSFAQPSLQAGLWEHSFEISSESGRIEAALAQAKQMLASLPPQQREMIERQMAASGINMDLQNYTAQVCITEAEAARNQFPEPSDNCTQTITEQNNDVFKLKFSCEGNPPVTGEGEIRMISDKQYRGAVTINTNIEGQTERMQATQSGTWLSKDCS